LEDSSKRQYALDQLLEKKANLKFDCNAEMSAGTHEMQNNKPGC